MALGEHRTVNLLVCLQICLFQDISDGLSADWVVGLGIVRFGKLSSIFGFARKDIAGHITFGSGGELGRTTSLGLRKGGKMLGNEAIAGLSTNMKSGSNFGGWNALGGKLEEVL